MNKLWEKGYQLNTLVEEFTVGEDYLLDSKLAFYDCLGSMAHAAMLQKIGVLNHEENHAIHQALVALAKEGGPDISLGDEDVHTAVENALGPLGKGLHAGRSRNDQVLVDLRLYGKDHLIEVGEVVAALVGVLLKFAERYAVVAIPGRTHMQRAMPSSFGLWAGAYAESLLDDLELLKSAFELMDQCPLGAGASYGVNLPLDRQMTTDLLGFSRVQNNALYCNNSRGKVEAVAVHALAQVMNDLSKLAADLIFFSLPEIGYLHLPETLCSGSSLMPQKRNPCGLELIRAKAATVSGYLMQLLEIVRGLPSGYHRDFQETKAPFLRAFDTVIGAGNVATTTVGQLEVDEAACAEAFSAELFATDAALELVKGGVPFRDAYRCIARDPEGVPVGCPTENLKTKTHLGAPGNLGLEGGWERLRKGEAWLRNMRESWNGMVQMLMGGQDDV